MAFNILLKEYCVYIKIPLVQILLARDCRIEQNSCLMRQFVASTSKTILIQLSISRIEFESFDFWRSKCPSCHTPFLCYLNRILSAASNCLLKNKVRNMNSKRSLEKSHGGSKRNYKNYNLNIIHLNMYFYFYTC